MKEVMYDLNIMGMPIKVGIDTTKLYVGQTALITTKSENKNMGNRSTSTKTVASATYHNVRDSKGRFTTRKPAASPTYHNVRDSRGRFVSASAPVKTSAPKTKTRANESNDLLNGAKSSFLSTMVLDGDYIVVTMQDRPKVEYGYAATVQNVVALRNARKNNRSMGSAYNAVLKGREVFVKNWK